MNWKAKLLYSQNWNIGFCEQTPEELIRGKALKPIQWLKHSYRDRWFADPFILKVTEEEIVVFVEECPMENPKGIISELVIDKKTKRLKNRYVMLEKDTHLSYPAIIRYGGKIYVYPENGASGKLNIYEYDEFNHRLVNPVCILDEAVADATIVQRDNVYYLTATKFPDTQKRLYLYKADSFWGPYKQLLENPVMEKLSNSRNGGNYFTAYGCEYRPSQDCSIRYGGGLSIMRVNGMCDYQESAVFGINPLIGKYDLGIHTLNFEQGIAVIDGYGYLHPRISRAWIALSNIKNKIVRR